MSLVALRSGLAGKADRASRVDAMATLVPIAFVVALWAICHPYAGIIGDATIYIGRAMADLDPDGLGRDLIFANDGQSQFSVFRLVVRPLVAALGPETAAIVIAAAASLAWSLALVALAHGFAKGRAAWAMAITVAVLPIGYGQTRVFSFGESMALPRPFAEAAVMVMVAALLRRRPGVAAGALALALAIHPIMALAGLGVATILFAWHLLAPLEEGHRRDPAGRRLRLVGLAVLAGLAPLAVGLAWLGVPVLNRLLVVADPDWVGMFIERSPHLFPTLWSARADAPLVIEVATIAIAASLASGTGRRMFVAILVAGLGGLAAAVLFADRLHILLAIQVQPWRMVWLVGVVGGAGLAFCAAELWPRGFVDRVVLALLALGWFFQPDLQITSEIAAFALVLHFGAFGRALAPKAWHVAVVYGLVLGVIALFNIEPVVGFIDYLRTKPDHAIAGLINPLRNNLHTAPLCLLTACWLHAPAAALRRFGSVAAPALTACLVIATAALWDQRDPDARYFQARQAPPGFAALAAYRPREVLWLDGLAEPWYALRRPQYLSPQQAVSIVFSRPLAMEWRRRAEALVALGLARTTIFRPWAPADDGDRIHVTQETIDRFCARLDAPGVILMPIERDAPPPRIAGMMSWHLPSPRYVVERHSTDEWHIVTDYGMIPCAAPRASRIRRAGL